MVRTSVALINSHINKRQKYRQTRNRCHFQTTAGAAFRAALLSSSMSALAAVHLCNYSKKKNSCSANVPSDSNNEGVNQGWGQEDDC